MTGSTNEDPAEAMRLRLQTALRSAIKARALIEVATLRGLIAAIDNAGAVPPIPDAAFRYGVSAESSPYVVTGAGQGPNEVERRRLGVEEVQALLSRELELRQTAAAEFTRLGRQAEAERAQSEMHVVRRYLSAPA